MARPPSNIRQRIIRSARTRFLRDGVDGASMRSIASGARTSLGMITYYFGSKDELFMAVVEDVYEKLLADLEGILQRRAPVRERLRGALIRLGGASEVELDVIRMMVREALVSSRRLNTLLDRFMRGHLPLLLATIAEGQRDGVIAGEVPAPLAMVATFVMGALPQFARRAAGDRLPLGALPEGDAFVDVLLDMAFRGIGPRPPTS